MDLAKINATRERRGQKELRLSPLVLNINGRRFREDEINIKLANIYSTVDADLDWTFPEIFDPWKRAKKHFELFDDAFGKGRVDTVRYDHFLEWTHVCDGYKMLNRAYQLLKKGGKLIISYVDFKYLFNETVNTNKITDLEKLEKAIFTDSDSSGMYYHRTIWTQKRLEYYLKRSFFYEYEFKTIYHEVLQTDIVECHAIKDTDKQVELAPDGTLIEAK